MNLMQRGKSLAVLHGINVEKLERVTAPHPTPVSVVGALSNKPSPYNFDKFVPWVCSQWCASTAVLVTPLPQVVYARIEGPRKQSRMVRRSTKQKALTAEDSKTYDTTTYDTTPTSTINKGFSILAADRIVTVIAYYDLKQNLVEIAIVRNDVRVSRKVIHAISLCIPYHSFLTRFTFSKSCLNDELVYEINKLLPISNITEICFDDSYVREGNYYILLEQYSQLRYLSLNRCNINDEVCKKLFVNIDFRATSANSLQILELGTNNITDISAIFIASVLKMNRCLLHLNLSGNKITDRGFKAILDTLMEFPLSQEENLAMKRRRLIYLQNKIAVYNRCVDELKYGRADDIDSTTTSGKKIQLSVKRFRRKSRKTISAPSIADMAEIMTRGIVGDFEDPYSPENMVPKEGWLCCKGNFILAYLNMAYNDLQYSSLQKLVEVLQYQQDIDKSANSSGLIKVTLDGNYIPASCEELDSIDAYLRKVINFRTPVSRKTRTSSLLRTLSTPRVKSKSPVHSFA